MGFRVFSAFSEPPNGSSLFTEETQESLYGFLNLPTFSTHFQAIYGHQGFKRANLKICKMFLIFQ